MDTPEWYKACKSYISCHDKIRLTIETVLITFLAFPIATLSVHIQKTGNILISTNLCWAQRLNNIADYWKVTMPGAVWMIVALFVVLAIFVFVHGIGRTKDREEIVGAIRQLGEDIKTSLPREIAKAIKESNTTESKPVKRKHK
jgi:hypothetical protein